jgi:hypothetical protein
LAALTGNTDMFEYLWNMKDMWSHSHLVFLIKIFAGKLQSMDCLNCIFNSITAYNMFVSVKHEMRVDVAKDIIKQSKIAQKTEKDAILQKLLSSKISIYALCTVLQGDITGLDLALQKSAKSFSTLDYAKFKYEGPKEFEALQKIFEDL